MENQTCKICQKQIAKEYNFCPHCGSALTEIAKRLNKEKFDVIKLKLLNDIAEKIEDKKTLKQLNSIAEKITK